jgi:DNA-directed RNA polymerase alpha subunit
MLKRLIVLLIVGLMSFSANAQCKSFTKKKCLSELGEYVFNGQLNTAVLTSGEEAELRLSFYSKQGYRMYVCSEEQLGDVDFEVLDTDRNILYKSKENGSNIFDFKVPSTQQLIVRVVVKGDKTEHALDFQGCVSVLVGFIEE